MTDLHKPVSRRTDSTIRDAGKRRRMVVTLYPNGDTLGLRPEKTRREEFISIAAIYEFAVKCRVRKEQADKKKARKA